MYEKEIGEAMVQVRLGEVRTALTILTQAATAATCKVQPLYSDMLRLPVQVRRKQLGVAVVGVVRELRLIAEKLSELCGHIQSQDDKKSE